MSTDPPLTRRELRAQREAAEAAAVSSRSNGSEPEAAVPERVERPQPKSAVSRRPRGPQTPEAKPPTQRRRFGAALAAVLLALVVLAGGGAAWSLVQGPRVSSVQVDPAAAIRTSGSRLVFTANQSLEAVDPSQVTVTPAAPFTVDGAGRMVGVRFTVPLDDATTYTVTVDGVSSKGGGPSTTLTTSFTTPEASLYLLQRDEQGDDVIVRTTLDGDAQTVYTAPVIDDFRATSEHLVISESTADSSKVIVTDPDGGDPQPLTLPGAGTVTDLQVSERGEYVGYLYTDPDPGADGAQINVLYTASLRDPSADPVPLAAKNPPSIAGWRFVPDSNLLTYVDFSGDMEVVDLDSADRSPTPFGTASTVDAVTRGTYIAFVERLDTPGAVLIDLTTGEQSSLVEPEDDLGTPGAALPVPGGGTVRQFVTLGDDLLPQSQSVAFVADDGADRTLFTTGQGSALMQMCVSPSGRYAAVLEAPDLASNFYGTSALQAMPQKVITHIIEIDSGDEVSTLDGFDLSWCAVGPWEGGTS
ncbi:MAG: hypothetical protein QM607_07050 [Microbacterium sp.]